MAVTSHGFPQVNQFLGTKAIDLATDSLSVLLIASGTVTWNTTTEGYATVADFLANNGSPLTEVSTVGTGYARKTLTGVTFTTTGLITTLTCANVQWTGATFSAVYACWFDNTPASDSTRQLIAYWDFGGAVPVTSSTFQLTISGTGVATWTAS